MCTYSGRKSITRHHPSVQSPLTFSSRCVEPARGGVGDLPGRAADEALQTERGVGGSVLLRHLLPGLPPPAAAVRNQV